MTTEIWYIIFTKLVIPHLKERVRKHGRVLMLLDSFLAHIALRVHTVRVAILRVQRRQPRSLLCHSRCSRWVAHAYSHAHSRARYTGA